jgi:ketosteroid isomerase-like protein
MPDAGGLPAARVPRSAVRFPVTLVTLQCVFRWRTLLANCYVSASVRPHVGMTATCTAMLRNLSCCLLLAVCAVALAAQQADPRETKLLVLERLWNEAQVNRDAQALNALVASRFVNTEYDGEISDKQKFLAEIKDPLFKPTMANIQDVKMNFFGDTAVITGIYHTQGTYQGRPYDHVGRFTDTWVLDSGKWQCVASHTSLIKK